MKTLKIRLARYTNQWTYYDTIFEDKGIYYQFTATIPGFSYFAIVNYELIDKSLDETIDEPIGVDIKEPIDVDVDVNTPKDLDSKDIVDANEPLDSIDKEFKLNFKTTMIVLGVVILVLLIIFLIIRFRNEKDMGEKW